MVQVSAVVSASVRSVLSEVMRSWVGGESTVMDEVAARFSGLSIPTSTVYWLWG